MMDAGVWAFDCETNHRVQVIERIESWGFVSYRVYDAEKETVSIVPAARLADEPPDKPVDLLSYLRFVALRAKIRDVRARGILTSLSNGVIPLPHQRHVLERAVSSNSIRYILADEVGLGKTIEAGLIIKELKARGLVKRVLVVCPTGLVTQWTCEMKEKFGEIFHPVVPDDFNALRRLTGRADVYGAFDQVITPMDSIKPLERRSGWSPEKIADYNRERIEAVVNAGWDLIVIDEAHRVAGSSGEVARHKLGRLLAEACPYLLLLTATPHNGKTDPFLRLVRLVDRAAFPNAHAIVKEQVAPYVIRTEKREAIDNQGNVLFKKRHTHVLELHWGEMHSLQRALYEHVTEYVSENYNLALRNRGRNAGVVFLLIMLQRLVTSSTAAIRDCLERRIDVLERQAFRLETMTEEEFAEAEPEAALDGTLSAFSLDVKKELSELRDLVALAEQAEYQYPDVKFERLLALMDELFASDGRQKVIVFTEFIATQRKLGELLARRGLRTVFLNGGLDREERNRVLRLFRDEAQILISTDAGGEGLNLQFAHILVNFDLPWNPMKIEQRIGRVDRIGQARDVDVYNFTLADTVESRVKDVLEAKLGVILQELGIDKYADVLDGETAGINFTDAYMNAIQRPKKIEAVVVPVEDDLRGQVEDAVRVRELIHEEKDLRELLGKEETFDVATALGRLVGTFERANGGGELPIGTYRMDDEHVVRLLRQKISVDARCPVPIVAITGWTAETGIFMLWHLTVDPDGEKGKCVPIFVNDAGVVRPMTGRRVWEALQDEALLIHVREGKPLESAQWARVIDMAYDTATDDFLEMKSEHEAENEESFRKVSCALRLRETAAGRIGIDRIRRHKLAELARERENAKALYEGGKGVCPDFHLELLIRVETMKND